MLNNLKDSSKLKEERDNMKREITAVATVLSLAFAAPAFATEGTKTSQETSSNFEQVKDNYLKRLEDRMNRLQQEKTCIEKAQNQDELRNCKWKNKGKRQEYRGKKKGSEGSTGTVEQSGTPKNQ